MGGGGLGGEVRRAASEPSHLAVFGSLQSGIRDEMLPRRFLTAVPARAHALIYIDALERGEKRERLAWKEEPLVKAVAHKGDRKQARWQRK